MAVRARQFEGRPRHALRTAGGGNRLRAAVVGEPSHAVCSSRSLRASSSTSRGQNSAPRISSGFWGRSMVRGRRKEAAWRRGAFSGDGNEPGSNAPRVVGQGPNGKGMDAFLDRETLRELRRLESLVDPVLELQSSSDLDKLRYNIKGVTEWKTNLSAGLLPDNNIEWPDETFRNALLGTLKDLDMARFTRKHPAVLTTLMRNILEMLQQYELELEGNPDEGEDGESDSGQQQSQNQQQSDSPGDSESEEDDPQDGEGGEGQGSGQGEGDGQGDGNGDNVENFEMSLEASDPQQSENGQEQEKQGMTEERAKEIAEKLMEDFKEQWEPAMDNLETAEKAFSGLDQLMDGPLGFDLANGLWQQRGWLELEALRKKLADLKELRDLIRELGRGSGKGPLRRAPAQAEAPRRPMGVVRSTFEPSETRGLTRSGDLSLMVPSEASLLAGPRPMQLLLKARFAERTLLTYERAGWVEETTRVLARTEVRPSATRGPIIVCLDTSGSMMGARETVAKALVLECLRQAHKEARPCYVYAFSGPGDCEEMELSVTPKAMERLLLFLTMSFNGGTDVDEPLWRSLRRLKEVGWSDADMLLVTDGEIQPPNPDLVTSLNAAKEDLDLKVHGLLVGDAGNPDVMTSICSQVHKFEAWNKVQSRQGY
eukprot:CAMPEP_0118929978 /NCGR_PEP_ID=MMETSP1169-20130426/6820_1 /TAXON_ID=36882 /ORGANISM="Pyramimonas obovata, Strain CCMP722" /LENGTH=654 /DNA_ID=CAMNT_0006872267 /DNA_START=176 /DNA_END=2140 /DNA_ORIENTATION=+